MHSGEQRPGSPVNAVCVGILNLLMPTTQLTPIPLPTYNAPDMESEGDGRGRGGDRQASDRRAGKQSSTVVVPCGAPSMKRRGATDRRYRAPTAQIFPMALNRMTINQTRMGDTAPSRPVEILKTELSITANCLQRLSHTDPLSPRGPYITRERWAGEGSLIIFREP